MNLFNIFMDWGFFAIYYLKNWILILLKNSEYIYSLRNDLFYILP